MSINVLLTLVEQYKEAAQLIEAAQAEQEQLKIQIREALAERSTNYLEVGCHKVRLSDFSSTRLDSKAIKAVADAAVAVAPVVEESQEEAKQEEEKKDAE